MSNKGEKAMELFKQGYNCAQAVFGAFCDETGFDFETAVMLASPFGGGMGRLREVCGTVSGMLMAAGMLYGYNSPKHIQEKRRLTKQYRGLQTHLRGVTVQLYAGSCSALQTCRRTIPRSRSPVPRLIIKRGRARCLRRMQLKYWKLI